MTRGRLIWPNKVAIARLDLAAMEADADHRFGTPPERVELDPVILDAQVETSSGLADDRQRLRPSGDDPAMEVRLVLHYQDIEDLGLLDADGVAVFSATDRLVALYDQDDVLLTTYPAATDRKALYCVKARDQGHGLSSASRNLLILEFGARDAGTNRVS